MGQAQKKYGIKMGIKFPHFLDIVFNDPYFFICKYLDFMLIKSKYLSYLRVIWVISVYWEFMGVDFADSWTFIDLKISWAFEPQISYLFMNKIISRLICKYFSGKFAEFPANIQIFVTCFFANAASGPCDIKKK